MIDNIDAQRPPIVEEASDKFDFDEYTATFARLINEYKNSQIGEIEVKALRRKKIDDHLSIFPTHISTSGRIAMTLAELTMELEKVEKQLLAEDLQQQQAQRELERLLKEIAQKPKFEK